MQKQFRKKEADAASKRASGVLSPVKMFRNMQPNFPNFMIKRKEKAEIIGDIEFGSEDFKPHAFNTYRSELQEAATSFKNQLQEIVYENYEKFIESSRDIEGTEKEVEELGVLLNDLRRSIREMSKLELTMEKDDLIRPRIIHAQPNDYLSILDVAIIKQNFEEAIHLLDKVKMDQVNIIDYQARKHLIKSLLLKLLYSSHPDYKEKEIVTYLTRLESKEVARDIYLDGKSNVLRSGINDAIFTGDIPFYASQISEFEFQSILKTGKSFQKIFNQHSHMSAFAQWILEEMDYFCSKFIQQVFLSDEFDTIAKCVNIVLAHCQKLEDFGISVSFHLMRSISKDVTRAIENFHNSIELAIAKSLADERFNAKQETVLLNDETVSQYMTPSAHILTQELCKFIDQTGSIANNFICAIVVRSTIEMFETYLGNIYSMGLTEHLNDKQFVSIMANINYITKTLLQFALARIVDVFKRPIPELENLITKLSSLYDKFNGKYCSIRASLLVNEKIKWNSLSYYPKPQTNDEKPITNGFLMVIHFVSYLVGHISELIGSDHVKSVCEKFLLDVSKLLNDRQSEFWTRMLDAFEENLAEEENLNSDGSDEKNTATEDDTNEDDSNEDDSNSGTNTSCSDSDDDDDNSSKDKKKKKPTKKVELPIKPKPVIVKSQVVAPITKEQANQAVLDVQYLLVTTRELDLSSKESEKMLSEVILDLKDIYSRGTKVDEEDLFRDYSDNTNTIKKFNKTDPEISKILNSIRAALHGDDEDDD
ncbi:exocyst complex component 8 [Acrasis kona]|uniref:Exocyst complex component 8 n=1 Tax=Acrasis kona TaxID=1008807 RepID=A0AAW2YME8_9EUKA